MVDGNDKSSSQKYYFLMTFTFLVVTVVLAVGVCFGAIFVFYKLFKSNRERYFEFNDNNNYIDERAVNSPPKAALSRIEEEAHDEENGEDGITIE